MVRVEGTYVYGLRGFDIPVFACVLQVTFNAPALLGQYQIAGSRMRSSWAVSRCLTRSWSDSGSLPFPHRPEETARIRMRMRIVGVGEDGRWTNISQGKTCPGCKDEASEAKQSPQTQLRLARTAGSAEVASKSVRRNIILFPRSLRPKCSD